MVEGGGEVLNVFGSAKTTIVMVFVIRSRRVERLDNFRGLFRAIPPGLAGFARFPAIVSVVRREGHLEPHLAESQSRAGLTEVRCVGKNGW